MQHKAVQTRKKKIECIAARLWVKKYSFFLNWILNIKFYVSFSQRKEVIAIILFLYYWAKMFASKNIKPTA